MRPPGALIPALLACCALVLVHTAAAAGAGAECSPPPEETLAAPTGGERVCEPAAEEGGRRGTRVTRYTPFAQDGELKPHLRASRERGAGCSGISSRVRRPGVYQCWLRSTPTGYVSDPCYLDPAAPVTRVVCVDAPWRRAVVIARAEILDESFKPRPERAWAVRAAGRRCLWDSDPVVPGRQWPSFWCGRGHSLFGRPDTSHATWTIRYGTYDGDRYRKRRVKIRRAWV